MSRLSSWFIDPIAYFVTGVCPWLAFGSLDMYASLDLGKPGDPLPEGYLNYRQDEGHLARECAASTRYRLIGREGRRGTGWHFGPFWFEKYVGDVEPAPAAGGPRRMIIWQQVTRTDAPPGWKRSRSVMNVRMTGFAAVGSKDEYFKNWTPHARRHRNRWMKQNEWEIVAPTLGEFLAAYKLARKDAFLKHLFSGLLREQIRAHGGLVRWIGIRRKNGDGRIEAGFAFVDVPESRQSIHLISFIHESARHDAVGFGMMDHWFRYAIDHGIRFLDFDRFWAPGEPPSSRSIRYLGASTRSRRFPPK